MISGSAFRFTWIWGTAIDYKRKRNIKVVYELSTNTIWFHNSYTLAYYVIKELKLLVLIKNYGKILLVWDSEESECKFVIKKGNKAL